MLRETISLDGLRVCFLYGMLKSSRELTSTFFVECLVPRCQVGTLSLVVEVILTWSPTSIILCGSLNSSVSVSSQEGFLLMVTFSSELLL